MGQLGDMILDLNDILRNEFYPIVGKEKSRWFEAIWGPTQGLLSAAAISIAAHAKITQEPHFLHQHQAPDPSHMLLLSSLACLSTKDSPPPGCSLFPRPLPERSMSPTGIALAQLKRT